MWEQEYLYRLLLATLRWLQDCLCLLNCSSFATFSLVLASISLPTRDALQKYGQLPEIWSNSVPGTFT